MYTVIPEPEVEAPQEEFTQYNKYIDDSTLAQCYMLASMTLEFKRQHKNIDARSILLHLHKLFEE